MSRQMVRVETPKYTTLPAGSIEPKGWLLRQLEIQSQGLPGRADEFFFKGEYWLGGEGPHDPSRKPTDLGSSHLVVGWLDALLDMAYLLNDEKLKDKLQVYIEYILSTQEPDGSFGPKQPNDSVWPNVDYEHVSYEGARVNAARILLKYYHFTKDERALELVKNFILKYYGQNYEPGDYTWFNNIGQKAIRGIAATLYEMTEDIAYMQAIEKHISYETPESDWKTGFKNKDPKCTHGALFAGLGSVAEDYLYSGDDDCKPIIDDAIAWLDATQGQVGGHYTAHEFIAKYDGRNPTNGSECCPIHGHVGAMSTLFKVFGDNIYADRLEELMFNSVAAFMTGDAWAHQYDQQVNQILCTTDKRRFDNRDDANTFAVNPHYPCCTASIGRPLPSFINNQWLRTTDGGLMALSYCPVEVNTTVGDNVACRLTVESEYPFRGTNIKFTVHVEKPVEFPIYLRSPEYIGDYGERTAVMVDGKMHKIEPLANYVIRRTWNDGDTFEMNIPMNTKFIERSDSSVSVKRGPLYYGLRVGEAYRQLRHNYEGSADWEIYPATKWNIGLYAPLRAAYASVDEEHNSIPAFPYGHQEEVLYQEAQHSFRTNHEKEPVILHVRGRVINNWRLHRIYAMSDEIKPDEEREYGEEVDVELIPYGCTNLRIAEFPSIK